jgi:RiboL-PSP-HEPN
MPATVVDRLHEQFTELVGMLDKAAEPSLRAFADDSFRKSLLLCAASHFETEVTSALTSFVEEASNSNVLISAFMRNKAIGRQYFTLFSWDGTNANQFFGYFGPEFTNYMKARVKAEPQLDESIRAFLEIGRERNRLVHQNYGMFTLEKTADELYQRYQQERKFIELFPLALKEFLERELPQTASGGSPKLSAC